MGAFTAYSFSVSIFLFLGWAVYRFALAGCKQPAFNRRIIIAIYVLSFLGLPLSRAVVALGALFFHGGAGQIAVESTGLIINVLDATTMLVWPIVVVGVYFAGAILVGLRLAVGILQMRALVRKGERHDRLDFSLVILPSDSQIAPFSFGRTVVVSDTSQNVNPLILSHEHAHIKLGHRYDLILANLVCVIQWFNPAAWFLLSDLRCLHEYEADELVLSSGADKREYQHMLVRAACGVRFKSVTNSFNSNLKKRIKMMYQSSSSGRERYRALVLVPALALAFGFVHIPVVASVLSATSAASIPEGATQYSADAPNADVRIIAFGEGETATPSKGDVLPQYPGGEQAMFRFLAENIKYPASMVADKISGRVVVRFTVEANGELSDISVVKGLCADADREALRVVAAMPRWIPGTSDGKPVACGFALPISFMLVGDDATDGENDVVRVVAEDKHPTIFVNGEAFKGDLNSISPEDIESVTVRKDLTEYPDGLIEIKLKKK